MEAFILIDVDNDQRHHNNVTQFDRTHSRDSLPIPGANCLFSGIKFIQHCYIIHNNGELRHPHRFKFFRHYHDKCYGKLDSGFRCCNL